MAAGSPRATSAALVGPVSGADQKTRQHLGDHL